MYRGTDIALSAKLQSLERCPFEAICQGMPESINMKSTLTAFYPAILNMGRWEYRKYSVPSRTSIIRKNPNEIWVNLHTRWQKYQRGDPCKLLKNIEIGFFFYFPISKKSPENYLTPSRTKWKTKTSHENSSSVNHFDSKISAIFSNKYFL